MNFKNNFIFKKKSWETDSAGPCGVIPPVESLVLIQHLEPWRSRSSPDDVLTPERTGRLRWWWILPGSLRPIGSPREQLRDGIGHRRPIYCFNQQSLNVFVITGADDHSLIPNFL